MPRRGPFGGRFAFGANVGCMEISPLPMAQILEGRDGRRYELAGYAAVVAADVMALDPTLRVQFNEGGGFFVVYQLLNQHKLPDVDGDIESVVLRVPMGEWDGRVIDYMALRGFELRHGTSINDRLDAAMDARKKAKDDELEQAVGEWAGKAFHNAQRDLGTKPRIFLPRGIAA